MNVRLALAVPAVLALDLLGAAAGAEPLEPASAAPATPVAPAAPADSVEAAAPAVTMEDLERRIAELEAAQREAAAGTAAKDTKKPMRSTVGVELYGYIKLDAAYDSSRIDTGNFARWVFSEQTRNDDSEFSMTANQTRLGLKFFGPELVGAETGGLVEMDFYGGGTENKPNPMMRKAYLTIAWPGIDLKVLAGQDSDLVSPLAPDTVNYTVLWWVGNIGYRRPQIRLTKGFSLGNDVRLELAAAATRTIGIQSAFDTGSDTGEDAGFPTAQGRVGLSFPLLTAKPTALGLSGHWGREEYDIDPAGDDREFPTWSIDADATIPIASWLGLKGECFVAENVDDYRGGIGQGVTIVAPGGVFVATDPVHSYGGWLLAGIGPFGAFRFNAGASAELCHDDDLRAGDRLRNFTYLGNVFFRFYQNLELALEVSYWRTEYVQTRRGDAIRGQMALIFNF